MLFLILAVVKRQHKHNTLANRKKLISENVVQLPEGMTVTKPALVQKPIVEEVVEPVVAPKKAAVKKTTAKKKTKAKKK